MPLGSHSYEQSHPKANKNLDKSLQPPQKKHQKHQKTLQTKISLHVFLFLKQNSFNKTQTVLRLTVPTSPSPPEAPEVLRTGRRFLRRFPPSEKRPKNDQKIGRSFLFFFFFVLYVCLFCFALFCMFVCVYGLLFFLWSWWFSFMLFLLFLLVCFVCVCVLRRFFFFFVDFGVLWLVFMLCCFCVVYLCLFRLLMWSFVVFGRSCCLLVFWSLKISPLVLFYICHILSFFCCFCSFHLISFHSGAFWSFFLWGSLKGLGWSRAKSWPLQPLKKPKYRQRVPNQHHRSPKMSIWWTYQWTPKS